MKYLPHREHIDTLWQIVNAAGELTRDRRTYLFNTQGPITCYLRAEKAQVQIARWDLPRVEVHLRLEGKFGWRVAADQDEVGVYIAAHRRRVVGGLSSALFNIVVPRDTYLVLNLTGGRVTLDDVNGTLQIPPLDTAAASYLLTSGDEVPLVQN